MHEAKDGVSAVHLFWILLFQVSFCWAHSSTAIYIYTSSETTLSRVWSDWESSSLSQVSGEVGKYMFPYDSLGKFPLTLQWIHGGSKNALVGPKQHCTWAWTLVYKRENLSSVLAPAWLLLGSSHPFGSSTQMILTVVLLLSLGSLISYPPTPSIFMVWRIHNHSESAPNLMCQKSHSQWCTSWFVFCCPLCF